MTKNILDVRDLHAAYGQTRCCTALTSTVRKAA
jgi:hypothetical protein